MTPDRDDDFQRQARDEIEGLRGRRLHGPPGEIWAGFDGPARAVRCAKSLVAIAARLGFETRAGVHTGECRVSGSSVDGQAAQMTAHLALQAAPAEVLVSRTVKDLVAGSPFQFTDRGHLTFADTAWTVFSV